MHAAPVTLVHSYCQTRPKCKPLIKIRLTKTSAKSGNLSCKPLHTNASPFALLQPARNQQPTPGEPENAIDEEVSSMALGV
jgi:hypothetical protein